MRRKGMSYNVTCQERRDMLEGIRYIRSNGKWNREGRTGQELKGHIRRYRKVNRKKRTRIKKMVRKKKKAKMRKKGGKEERVMNRKGEGV